MNAQRRTLTAEQIVDAARTAIDEDGLASLSMRRLGARLGVDPMAIRDIGVWGTVVGGDVHEAARPG